VHTLVSDMCRLASGWRNWDDEAVNRPGNGVHTGTVAVGVVWPVGDQG